MKLRKADCGHWVPANLPPTGETADGTPVYLCPRCRKDVLHHASLLTTKVKHLLTHS